MKDASRILLVCLLCLCCPKIARAQQVLVDSLEKLLSTRLPDTARAISMMRLAIDYEVVDTAKAYQAYKKAIQFAKAKELNYFLGRIYQNQSFLYNASTRYAECRSSLDTAIMYYQKSNDSRRKLKIANSYSDIANVLRLQNDDEQAIQYYLKAIALIEQLGLTDELVFRYCNLSNLFGDQRDYNKEEEYSRKALAIAKKKGTKLNLFVSYISMAHALTLQEKNKEARVYLDSAHLNYNGHANIDIQVTYYLISAQVFRKNDQLDSAHAYFKKCYDVSKLYNYNFGMAESLLQLGAISILQKRYDEAEKYLLPGIALAEKVNNYNILDDGYKYLSDIYAVTGRYKQAFDYLWKYKDISDSLVDMESKKYTLDLEKKYETEKKESHIKQLEISDKLQQLSIRQKNNLNYILLVVVTAILVISILLYRTYKQKQRLQEQRIYQLEKERQLNATEAVLKGEEQERTRLAKDLHDGLGGMLSGIKFGLQTMKGNLIMTPENTRAFERSLDMLDSSIREMRRVAHNMMPEALVKFGLDTALRDYCQDINQSGAVKVEYQSIGLDNVMIEQTTAIALYRIVQELVSNILKHASAKTAIVQITKRNNLLSVTVEDDGRGFDIDLLKQSHGIGWSNIQNRVEFLKGKLDVNTQPGKGTSVLIEVGLDVA